MMEKRKFKILVADDDEVMLEMLRLKLDEHAFEVIVAKNGYEVLEQLECLSPDLILLDALMPDLNGLEVLNLIRHRYLGYKVPVIFISALRDGEVIQRALELGADEFWLKPLDPQLLIAHIDRHFLSEKPGFKT